MNFLNVYKISHSCLYLYIHLSIGLCFMRKSQLHDFAKTLISLLVNLHRFIHRCCGNEENNEQYPNKDQHKNGR